MYLNPIAFKTLGTQLSAVGLTEKPQQLIGAYLHDGFFERTFSKAELMASQNMTVRKTVHSNFGSIKKGEHQFINDFIRGIEFVGQFQGSQLEILLPDFYARMTGTPYDPHNIGAIRATMKALVGEKNYSHIATHWCQGPSYLANQSFENSIRHFVPAQDIPPFTLIIDPLRYKINFICDNPNNFLEVEYDIFVGGIRNINGQEVILRGGIPPYFNLKSRWRITATGFILLYVTIVYQQPQVLDFVRECIFSDGHQINLAEKFFDLNDLRHKILLSKYDPAVAQEKCSQAKKGFDDINALNKKILALRSQVGTTEISDEQLILMEQTRETLAASYHEYTHCIYGSSAPTPISALPPMARRNSAMFNIDPLPSQALSSAAMSSDSHSHFGFGYFDSPFPLPPAFSPPVSPPQRRASLPSKFPVSPPIPRRSNSFGPVYKSPAMSSRQLSIMVDKPDI